jgi:hypothetical protein
MDAKEGDEVYVGGTTPGTVTFERKENGQTQSLQSAKELRISARPDNVAGTMVVTVELYGRSPGTD